MKPDVIYKSNPQDPLNNTGVSETYNMLDDLGCAEDMLIILHKTCPHCGNPSSIETTLNQSYYDGGLDGETQILFYASIDGKSVIAQGTINDMFRDRVQLPTTTKPRAKAKKKTTRRKSTNR